jgi:S-formylglutathione hydrolase
MSGPAVVDIKSDVRCFGGRLIRFSHSSSVIGSTMTCSVYLPPSAADTQPTPALVPGLLYLSGLTCTDENVCQKGGAFRALSKHGIAFIAPDTSPRGLNIPGDSDSWDFGVGAGFYVDASTEPWRTNYRMYSYITAELLTVVSSAFPAIDINRIGITGHSMGGHGALTIALKNPDKFKSVSAFAPICNPVKCPWGQKAFLGYLGPEENGEWGQYDACTLVTAKGRKFDEILVDVGTADSFLAAGQLRCDSFEDACREAGQLLTLRRQVGYDHGYFFVSSFVEDHVNFHAKYIV